jgi:hypothetical protein
MGNYRKATFRQEMMMPEEDMKQHMQRMENMMKEHMMMTNEIKQKVDMIYQKLRY